METTTLPTCEQALSSPPADSSAPTRRDTVVSPAPARTRTRARSLRRLGAVALTLTLPTLGVAAASLAPVKRPSLVNTNIPTPFSGNGQSMSFDGRLILHRASDGWKFRVFRPESVTYDAEGKPSFSSAFSTGKLIATSKGENASAMCQVDPAKPFTMKANGNAVYTPWIIDMRMGDDAPDKNRMRRRSSSIEVTSPFTTTANVSSVTLGPIEYLTTVSGTYLLGIEPTMTADGRLVVFQGHPSNNGSIDYLMYSYNPNPCAATGWSVPRPLSTMYDDPEPGLDRYPLSQKPLFAAAGEPFASSPATNTGQIRGAYPWLDPEGRDVLYMAVKHTNGGRREAATLIGADTGFTAYNIDGGINEVRQGKSRLFYSSPMWNFERERTPIQTWPRNTSNGTRYLPATKNHDVIPFFGSNTLDYNEVDIGDLSDPFHLLFLPMNELVTLGGEYDLTKTPDLSGGFRTATLVGTAQLSADNLKTQPSSGSLFEPHGKGRSLLLPGGGAAKVTLSGASTRGIGATVKAFSIQLALRPGSTINAGCAGTPWRYVVYKSDGTNGLDLIYESDDSVQMSFRINGTRVRLGRSQPLPKNKWTHVAYTWDGVSGEFKEYLDGVASDRALPVAKGTFKLGTGDLYIGAGSGLNAQACPSNGGGSFVGAIDEVRLFTHARSARSTCLTSMGADCIDEAVQDEPTSVQRVLDQQHPDCNGPEDLGGNACVSAMHRLCAQLGASEALDSAQNLGDTVTQLVSERPPISMAGVTYDDGAAGATVACTPIDHESVAVTYEELNRYQGGCKDDSSLCDTAAHRFCEDLGWSTGIVFERTSRPWVNCFDAGKVISVAKSALAVDCQQGKWTKASCQKSMNQACQAQGLDAGVRQEMLNGSAAEIHCFDAAALPTWKYTP